MSTLNWSDPALAPYGTTLKEVAREVDADEGWTESTLAKFVEVWRALIALEVRHDGAFMDVVPADPEQLSAPNWLHEQRVPMSDDEVESLAAEFRSQSEAELPTSYGWRARRTA